MSKLIKDFYKMVNCIINNIVNNKEISNKLFKCKYDIYEQNTKKLDLSNNKNQPLIFCLG
jgi:hypothetical protein